MHIKNISMFCHSLSAKWAMISEDEGLSLRITIDICFGILDILLNSSAKFHLGSGPFCGKARPTGTESKQIKQSNP